MNRELHMKNAILGSRRKHKLQKQQRKWLQRCRGKTSSLLSEHWVIKWEKELNPLSQGSRTRCFLMSQRERERLLGMKFFPWRQCITRNGRSSLNESCIKLLSLIACGARFNTAFSVWEHNALHCIGRHQFSSSKIKSLFSKVLILHTNGEKWKGKTESNPKWNLNRKFESFLKNNLEKKLIIELKY